MKTALLESQLTRVRGHACTCKEGTGEEHIKGRNGASGDYTAPEVAVVQAHDT